jgi:hypothetical protein
MRITLEKGVIAFNAYDLLEALPVEQQREFADCVALQPHVCELVAQQICDGATEWQSYRSDSFDYRTGEPKGIALARRMVAKDCERIRKDEIELLEKQLAETKTELRKFQELERLRDDYNNPQNCFDKSELCKIIHEKKSELARW